MKFKLNKAEHLVCFALLNKIEKAGNVFVNGFKDPHTMHQWAKKKYNSQYAGSGDIIFKDKLWKVTGKSWMYTFMYRFPDSSASKELAQLLEGGEKKAVQDAYIGFGLGCVYGSLTHNPDTAKVVKVKVEPIEHEYQQNDRSDFTSYIVTLADSTKLNLMVDWKNEQEVDQVRYRISSDKLDITNESHILGCNKVLTKIENALQNNNLVLISGGISVGDYDFVKSALEELMGDLEKRIEKVVINLPKVLIIEGVGSSSFEISISSIPCASFAASYSAFSLKSPLSLASPIA